jgi:GTP-binding protein HflX
MERAALVGLHFKGKDHAAEESSLAELKGLLETAGGQSVCTVVQERTTRDPATFLGKGKVDEIAGLVEREKLSAVVINHDLSPSQQQNLQDRIPAKIIDRTRLILDIFAQRARTREGKLQVELAQLNYLLPRATEKFGRFEQQVGGIGTRGPGERKLEISQRRIRDRIARLRREIEGVRRHRALQRENRQRLPMPVVALVGYTNAGKSTLLNALHTSPAPDVYADDKLFATLDPTTRRVRLPGGRTALFVDTVGFIQHLPHHLVAAYHATLEEARDADLLVHVIDVSNPEWALQREVVREVLRSLDAGDLPSLDVFNKEDRLTKPQRVLHQKEGHLLASATSAGGLSEFLSRVEDHLNVSLVEREFVVPHERQDLWPRLHEGGRLLSQTPVEGGTRVRVNLNEKNWGYIQKELGLKQ